MQFILLQFEHPYSLRSNEMHFNFSQKKLFFYQINAESFTSFFLSSIGGSFLVVTFDFAYVRLILGFLLMEGNRNC